MGGSTNKAEGRARLAFGKGASERALQREGRDGTGQAPAGAAAPAPSDRHRPAMVQGALDKMAGKMGDRRRAREEEQRERAE